VGNVSRPLALTLGAVLLVLLITCANVASLLLSRASSRQRELAVRAALGAGRARIARQLLTESLVLALGGGLLGAVLAFWAVQGIARTGVDIPRAALVQVDGTVLLFTLGITLLAGALFGVLPAVRATGASLDGALRSGGRGSVGVGLRLRSALVVGQVALAVILVTAATLTTKSFSKLLAVDLGFRPENALFVEMSIGDRYATPSARRAYYATVLDAIRDTPGVVSVGAIRDLPTRGRGEIGPISVAGVADDPNGRTIVQYHQVSSDFFTAMETPVKRGRAFTARDREDAPLVAIINEELARRAFPGQDPTTKALRFGTQDVQIVGVVGDIRQSGAVEPIEPSVYLHAQQSFRSRMSIVVRTKGNPLALAPSVRQAIWNLDAQQTIATLAPLEEILGKSVAQPRLLASLFAMFGLLGLALGALGIYGLLAFNVNQRVREIGVRLALGATPVAVRVMFVKQGLVLAFVGLAIGIGAALAGSGVIEAVLYGFEAIDPLTLVQVALAVAATAVVASWIPARRATTVDPAVTLRSD
jgi:predicted permease